MTTFTWLDMPTKETFDGVTCYINDSNGTVVVEDNGLEYVYKMSKLVRVLDHEDFESNNSLRESVAKHHLKITNKTEGKLSC